MTRENPRIFKGVDWPTVTIYLILVILGWINIYAAVFNEEHYSILDISQRYGKQLLWIGAAFLLILVIFLVDSQFFYVFAYFIYGATLLLLISVIFLGTEINASRAWFQIGSFRLQPSEFAKFATSLALSRYMSQYNFNLLNPKTLFRVGVFILTPSLLILFQNDTGSALVYAAFVLVLYREGLPGHFLIIGALAALLFVLTLLVRFEFLAATVIFSTVGLFYFLRRNLKETLIAGGILLAAGGLAYLGSQLTNPGLPVTLWWVIAIEGACIAFVVLSFYRRIPNSMILVLSLAGAMLFISSVDYIFHNVLEDHQQNRISVLLGLKSDPLGTGYNVNQSKIAIGSGGLLGKGFLEGTQTKFNFVPEQSTDFIFCTVGEEWGFIGSSIIILLFVLLLLRLIFLAERQRSDFNRILGYCVVAILFFHVTINIGMTIGLLPVIGIPLPFFSYGGSSLWGFTILLFIFIKLDSTRFDIRL